jgi:hypothetical protein
MKIAIKAVGARRLFYCLHLAVLLSPLPPLSAERNMVKHSRNVLKSDENNQGRRQKAARGKRIHEAWLFRKH